MKNKHLATRAGTLEACAPGSNPTSAYPDASFLVPLRLSLSPVKQNKFLPSGTVLRSKAEKRFKAHGLLPDTEQALKH